MVTPEELRIGNWVMTPGGAQQVSEITSNGIYTKDYKDTWAEIKGLPLTKDILVKIGFRRINEYRYERELGCPHRYLEICYYGSNVYLMLRELPEMSGEDIVSYQIGCPKYLHNLQNLYFALTGKELNIEL